MVRLGPTRSFLGVRLLPDLVISTIEFRSMNKAKGVLIPERSWHGSPNLEIFKFGLYLSCPIGMQNLVWLGPSELY
jgi:hypothetical protein